MIKFGPSGNDILFYKKGLKGSENAPKFLNSLGLNAYEYPCGRGIHIKKEKAILIGEEAKKYNISVSVHAPYFINFTSRDKNQIDKSIDYVLNSLRLVKLFKGNRVVVHTGTNGKLSREEAMQECIKNLKLLLKKIYEEKLDDCFVCLETMGKYTQIGNYEEIVRLCSLDKIFIPTFDFGHINCIMQGALRSKEDFIKILSYAIEKLGYDRIKNIHIHFSQIQFSEKGELKHLTLDNGLYGPDFEPLALAIKELKIEPTIICESKEIMAQDAVKMKKIYENICQ